MTTIVNLEIKNKEKIPLLIDYDNRSILLKMGGKWDKDAKYFYYPSLNGKLPLELQPYRRVELSINKEDYTYYKGYSKSIKYCKIADKYYINQQDLEEINKIIAE